MASGRSVVDELRTQIHGGNVLAVVGAGFARAASGDKAPGWSDLIESGIRWCREHGTPGAACDLMDAQVAMKGDPNSLLLAATSLELYLSQLGSGEVRAWLEDVFSTIEPETPAVVQALHRLGCPILTSNYDGLIEAVTQKSTVTWRSSADVVRFAQGDASSVFHVHGHWKDAASVVLGLSTYERVKESLHAQAVLRAMCLTKRWLFIGCGEGLSDPNFGRLLSWLRAFEADAGVSHRHFRLVAGCEGIAENDGRIFPVDYGPEFEALPEYLHELAVKPQSGKKKQQTQRKAAKSNKPPVVVAYLERLAEVTGHLTLLGLGRSLQIDLPIADAYVPLRTDWSRSFETRKMGKYSEKGVVGLGDKDVPLDSVFQYCAAATKRGVVLLGEPGSGKTTGARQLAWTLASGRRLPEDLGLPAEMTPVYLQFRTLQADQISSEGSLKQFLADSTYCDEAGADLADPGEALWNGEAGGLLWILDGLDEVSDPEARRQVSGWIQRALQNRPRDWFLVTCRYQGYYREGVPLGARFLEFHVRPLDEDQVTRFIGDWYQCAYGQLYPEKPNLPVEKAAALVQVLSEEEYQTRKMKVLSSNPLMLTILCIVFHEDTKLPRERADVYKQCVRVLLDSWRRERLPESERSESTGFDAGAAKAVLARVAWWMHQEQGRTEAPLAELAKEAKSALEGIAASCGLGLDGAAFLERMRDETGILAMVGDGDCGFLHLSFQEYLAAEFAQTNGKGVFLGRRVAASWWQEVALLSLRQDAAAYGEDFFRAMLSRKPLLADNVAQRCLAESIVFPLEPLAETLEDETRSEPDRSRVLKWVRDSAKDHSRLRQAAASLVNAEDPETRELVAAITGKWSEKMPAPDRGLQVEVTESGSWVKIESGTFRMGTVKGGDIDERPVHDVVITEGFWLGRFPVTNQEYARFMADAGDVKDPEYWADRRFNQENQPVVGVNWDEAKRYCEWAGGRLPTEAEWEYACRAGTQTRYSFGDRETELTAYAWFGENAENQSQGIGLKKPNPWGLHDMHGNVWEWCSDWFSANFYERSPCENPKGPEGGSHRVSRGGSWYSSAELCRSAYRVSSSPGARDSDVGFRVARSSI